MSWIIAQKPDDQASGVLRLCDDPSRVAGLPRFVRWLSISELHGAGCDEDTQRDNRQGHNDECRRHHSGSWFGPGTGLLMTGHHGRRQLADLVLQPCRVVAGDDETMGAR